MLNESAFPITGGAVNAHRPDLGTARGRFRIGVFRAAGIASEPVFREVHPHRPGLSRGVICPGHAAMADSCPWLK